MRQNSLGKSSFIVIGRLSSGSASCLRVIVTISSFFFLACKAVNR
tara:strand:+ start:299 stop:433 length:135 start_codon:yes stop_codon:yes gene_type:complete